MKQLLVISILFGLAAPAFAKKDFKGLFGSYRREKFTENEANSTDFGMDLMLSTLLPVTPVIKSTEVRGAAGDSLYYATSFNLEGALFMTLSYEWEAFFGFGYFGYETRKQNTSLGTNQLPLFHQFEMSAIPMIVGVKYRLGTEDIVPYVGAGVGMSFVKRKASYDYNNVLVDEQSNSVITGEALVGLEFFFAPRMGLRLEAAAFYLNIPAYTFDTQGAPGNLPIFYYQSNIWSVRYASGIFFLF